MNISDIRVGMILRDRVNHDWTVVGIDAGTLRVVSVVEPTRITYGVKPDMLEPIPAPPVYDPAVEEPEPEAEPTQPKVTDEAWSDAWAFLYRTASDGGTIISSASLTAQQIAIARAAGRMLVSPGGLGYVWRPGPKWMGEDIVYDELASTKSQCDAALKERDQLKAKLEDAHAAIKCCHTSTWCDVDQIPENPSICWYPARKIRELRDKRNALGTKVGELEAKLSAAEKASTNARRLWESWSNQKEALAALDALFGGKS